MPIGKCKREGRKLRRYRQVRWEGARERQDSLHEISSGVRGAHIGKWEPEVVVCDGNGLNRGGRKKADGERKKHYNFGFHRIVIWAGCEEIRILSADVMLKS